MRKRKILFIFGTRPEGIKLAPLISKFRQDNNFNVKVCITGQHREMLAQVLDFFKIKYDYNLNIMQRNQTLFDISSKTFKKLEPVLDKVRPDIIFVQGDTTTAFISALCGFYKKIKIAHIEAGLRSFNKYSPFPEEINRVLISHVADFHFAPTKKAKENLLKEGIKKNIFIVGNSVIDALLWGVKLVEQNKDKYKKFFSFADFSKKIILVTGHRRESFGEGFKNICEALKEIAVKFKDEVEIIYPVHLNPNVRKPVYRILSKIKNIHLIEPVSYPYLIFLMKESYLILTDSGGIQEEAPSLGKPVIVMREVTERTEGIKAGTAVLAGTDKKKIIEITERLLTDKKKYQKMAKAVNPYGDGKTSERVLKIIKTELMWIS